MRNLLFWIVVTNLFLMEAAVADNNDSESVSVSGKVVKALEITVVSELRFGPVAIPNSTTNSFDTDTTAIIAVTDQDTGAFTITYTGQAGSNGDGNPGDSNIPAAPNDPAPAEITLTGEPNFNYVVSYSGFATVVMDFGVIVTIDQPSNGTQTLSTSGSDSLYIGGEFEVRTNATTGPKSGTFDVTVTYD